MKQKIYFLALMAMLIACATTVKADDITVGGSNRTYYTYIPKDLGENRPLLISMHGMNQDANYQKGMLQIESVADTAKFAVVFPEGEGRSWDIGGTKDINFVLAIIKDMQKRYAIDPDRVYLSGFSMGGMFTYHAINHIADRIAAFAPISGYPMGGQPFTSSRPVPIIHTHGTSDDVVNFGGAQGAIDGWIARNNCCKNPEVIQPYRAWHATKHIYGPGDEGVEVVLLELADKGHWIANDYFKTGEEIWNFCKRYSLHQDPPTVKINSPIEGYEVIGVGNPEQMTVVFDVEATSAVSEIDKVDLYVDDALVGTLTEAPYQYIWGGAKSGDHSIKVAATDSRGVSVARVLRPIKAKRARTKYNISQKFTAANMVPAGWMLNNGRTNRVGPMENVSGGSRVIKFTGAQRDFDYAIYVQNTSGEADAATATFGAPGSNVALVMATGAYRLTFTAAHWDLDKEASIRCRVINLNDYRIIAETEVTPTANVGGNESNSFSGSTNVTLDFEINTECPVKLVFMPDNFKKADALIGNILIERTGATSIVGIDSTATVEAVNYYDLSGRQCSERTSGIVIRQIRYSDGTVKTQKVINTLR